MEKIEQLYESITDKLSLIGNYSRPLDYFIDEFIIINKLQDRYPLMDNKIKLIIEDSIKTLSNRELTEFYSYCIDNDFDIKQTTTNNQYIDIVMGLLQINENDHFLDLGSGSGLLIKNVLDKYKVNKVTGIELSDRQYLISKMILSNYNNVELINGDFNFQHLDFDKVFLNPGIHYRNYADDVSFLAVEHLINLLKVSKTNKRAAIILRGTHLYSKRFKEDINSIIESGLVEGILSFSNFSNQLIIVLTNKEHDSVKLLDAKLDHDYNIDNIKNIIKTYFNNNEEVLNVKNDILIDEQNISPANIKNRLLIDETMKDYKKVTLGEICDIKIGSQYTSNVLEEKFEKLKKRNIGPAFKIIKASDIDEDGQINYDDLPYYSVDKINKDRLAKKRDILITSKTTNYKVCVIDDIPYEDYIIPSGGMFILRVTNKIDPYYIKAYFESSSGRLAIETAFKGEKVRVLNLTSLRNVVIPLLDEDKINEVIKDYHLNMKRINRFKKDLKEINAANNKMVNNIFK